MTDILEHEGKRLRLDFEEIRTKYQHPGNKGDHAEAILREFLGRYLPPLNQIGHGEVFSLEGIRSKQTDLVITNGYHIATEYDWSKPQAFIIESVECAAEFKSVITDAEKLRDIFDKAKTFKKMFIAPDQGMQARMQPEDARRFVWRKPFFGFSFKARLSAETIVKYLESWDQELRPVERPVLDALFILEQGTVIHFGDGQGSLRSMNADGISHGGYRKMRPETGTVLMQLLLWIYATMPKIEYFTHPAFKYLNPSDGTGKLHLGDDGALTRTTH